jgi:hypothetical protein
MRLGGTVYEPAGGDGHASQLLASTLERPLFSADSAEESGRDPGYYGWMRVSAAMRLVSYRSARFLTLVNYLGKYRVLTRGLRREGEWNNRDG